MDTIGIVGQGFVGGSLNEGMKHSCYVWTYDKFSKEKSNVESLELLVELCEIIFVCVPTPMFESGKCDISIVESVLEGIESACMDLSTEVTAVIKSTIPPGMTDYLNGLYDYVDIVFNPEFLREASPVEDFKNQNRIILGGEEEPVKKVAEIYGRAYPLVPILCGKSKEAEMVKYVTNCFLATKVSFANEIFQICEKMDMSYDSVIDAAKLDDRLGDSHWQVPGPDGSFGYGGHCFPKDLSALKYLSLMVGVDPVMLSATWDKNMSVRKKEERDWEQMKGRAVV